MARNTKIFLLVVLSFFGIALVVALLNPEEPEGESTSLVAAEKRHEKHIEQYEMIHGEGSWDEHLQEVEMSKTNGAPSTNNNSESNNDSIPLVIGLVIVIGLVAFFLITGGGGDPGIHGR